MNKRILAAFMVSIFIVAAALVAAPATAHTTLGRPTDTPPYRTFDNDINPQHAFGPTGYVWPGGGKDWWLVGSPDYTVSMEPPGYQSPWGWYPMNALPSWYQLQGNTYAPFGAILTSTEDYDNVGDLIFAINFTTRGIQVLSTDFNYTDLILYIPPEFGMVDEAGISTTINVPYGGNIIEVKIFGFDIDNTNIVAEQIAGYLNEIEGTRDILISRKQEKPELQIVFDLGRQSCPCKRQGRQPYQEERSFQHITIIFLGRSKSSGNFRKTLNLRGRG